MDDARVSEEQEPTCSACGAILPADAPAGHCPRCLARIAGAPLLPERKFEEGTADSESLARESPFFTLGDYELLEEIGRGGMGLVYRARQRSLERTVAVKVLTLGPLAGAEEIRRFRGEASAAGCLQHDNIVRIHEVGVHEGRHFIVMDHVEGEGLNDIVRSGPLEGKQAARYLRDIARAIDYAHQRGIIHRDLKPSNILIDADDRPRITDFGLAKKLDGSQDLTLTGQALGSPSYMAPEQASGGQGKVNRQTDVYALGALLYHLITGRPPFVGPTIPDTLAQVQNDEPASPRLLNPKAPADLETIALKCLEKEPPRRYGSAGEVADELDRFLKDELIQARPVSRPEKAWRWCRRRPALTTSLALLALAVVAGSVGVTWQWRRAKAQAEDNRGQLYAADMSVVHRAIEDGNLTLARQILENHIPRPGQTDLRGWEWRYFWGQTRQTPLFTIDVTGNRLAAPPDGKMLAVGGTDQQVRLVDIALRQVVRTLPAAYAEIGGQAFSCDGRFLAIASRDSYLQGTEGCVTVVDLQDGRTIRRFPSDRPRVRWAPAEPVLAFANGSTVMLWNPSDPEQKPARLEGAGAVFAFSPDGQFLAAGLANRTLSIWDLATRQPCHSVEFTGRPFPQLQALEFTPDGGALLLTQEDGRLLKWSFSEGEPPREIQRDFSAELLNLHLLPGDPRAIVLGADGVIRVCDLETGEDLAVQPTEAKAMALVPGKGAGTVAAVSPNQPLAFWDVDRFRRKQVPTLTGVLSAFFSPAGEGLLIAVETNKVVWHDTPTLTPRTTIVGVAADGRIQRFRGLQILPDGQMANIVETWPERTVGVKWWDLNTGRVLNEVTFDDIQLTDWMPECHLSEDTRLFATCGLDGVVRIFETRSGEETVRFAAHAKPVLQVTFCGRDRWLALAARDGSVGIWETGSWTRKYILHGHTRTTYYCATSPDGRLFATASADHTIRLWSTADGREVAHLAGGADVPFRLRFCSDSRTLVSYGYDQQARFWNVATGRQMFSLHCGPGGQLNGSQNGRFLSVRNWGSQLYLLRAPTIEEVTAELRSHP